MAGIQWMVANLIDGLLELGHELFLLGAPDSKLKHPRLCVVPGPQLISFAAGCAERHKTSFTTTPTEWSVQEIFAQAHQRRRRPPSRSNVSICSGVTRMSLLQFR